MMSSSVQEWAAAVDDEDVWVAAPLDATDPLHNSLKELEHQMRCPICCEFLHAPVSVIPCSHTFCSECIRTNFKKVSDECALTQFIFLLCRRLC
jgi:late competence protein required for DNA uptake (superfamily II DNA/RNA helicase)